MATDVIMPQMGFDMKEGTLVRWLKREGDAVRKGEMIAEIETDKAVVEIEAFGSGVLRKTYVGEGQTVPVGYVIGVIAAAGETVGDRPAGGASPKASPAHHPSPGKGVAAAPASGEAMQRPQSSASHERAGGQPMPASGEAVQRAQSSASLERLKVSPLAKREAEERKIDLAQVTGTGPGGRITREDVVRQATQVGTPAKAGPATPAPGAATLRFGETAPLTRMRQAIARNMTRSKQEIPHVYITAAMDMTRAVDLRQQLNEALGAEARVSVNDMVLRACALALRGYPVFNASYTEAGITVHPQINIGMAIALPDGLVAPAILECDKKSVAEIAQASKVLAERARAGRLTAQEYTGATFNVTNLGMHQVESFSAIITPPQTGALAVGAVQQEPVVRGGQVQEASVMRVTLSLDHRAADGAQGALFLKDVRALLENPVRLLL